MGSAARTVNLPLHGGKTYTPLCRHAQHFFSHSAAFTKYISKCRLFPYGLRNRARFLSRQRTAIPPWHLTVGRLFCWESPYCLRQYGLWSPCFAFAQYGLLVALFRFRSIRALVALLPAGNTGSGRPISLSLNTGSGRPISLSLNTGSIYGYVLGPGPLRAYASAPHPRPRPHGAGHRSPAAFAHRVPIPSNGGLCQRVQLYSLYIIIW